MVLIPKGNGSYRPICLLGSLAKGFDSIVEARPLSHAEEFGLMSNAQYGFRSKRSVLSAIHRVVSKAETIHQTTGGRRDLFMAVLLDVKNAFNSLPWTVILRTLRKKRIPKYLVSTVSCYL